MRAFIADTVALVLFFTVLGALNEHYVAGMAWSEVARSRAIGAPLMVLTARPYGVWRDWLMPGLTPPLPRLATDALSLLIFQVPIYAAILWLGGASGAGILKGAAVFSLMMMVVGRPYGVWLDFVRARFGLGPGGMKPMTLGD
ncbi:L-alanine exporter AlaE [Pelagibius sp. 7325]|uniref:L-alanine exporter AlaE n=1 Tax=Pelagibius sp. 7325 TaxID=3131994 RepID=UPI0030EEEBBA